MSKEMLFFINPNAGRADIRNYLLDVLAAFSEGDYRIHIYPTRYPKEITEVIAREGENYDMVVCCGGDGTLNETVSGLMQLEHQPLLGYIPAGTVNDFASSLHISKTIPTAARNIVDGVPFACDMGMWGGQYFTYVAGFGAFTEVSYDTPHEQKQALGRLAYLLEGARSLTRIRPYHVRVEHDKGCFEDDVLLGLVTNATSVGGFKAPASAKAAVLLDDGLNEVILVRNVTNLTDMNRLTNSLLRWDLSGDQFVTFQTDHLHFEFDQRVPWTLDGEYGGMVKDVTIRNVPKAVRIMVPRDNQLPALKG